MKKYLSVFIVSLMLSHSALAVTTIPWTKEGCESVKGKWLTAHSATDSGCDEAHCNGMNFCKSEVGLNWWSAFIWCKSIGRKLADIESACPNSLASWTCANLKGLEMREHWLWINMPRSTNKALGMISSRAQYNDFDRTYGSNTYALCE